DQLEQRKQHEKTPARPHQHAAKAAAEKTCEQDEIRKVGEEPDVCRHPPDEGDLEEEDEKRREKKSHVIADCGLRIAEFIADCGCRSVRSLRSIHQSINQSAIRNPQSAMSVSHSQLIEGLRRTAVPLVQEDVALILQIGDAHLRSP